MRRRFIYKREIVDDGPSVDETNFDYKDYMTIEILDDNCAIECEKNLIYGVNGHGWYYANNTGIKYSIPTKKGDFISIKYRLSERERFGRIYTDSRCNLRGNCLSLIFLDDAKYNTDIASYPSVFENTFRDLPVVSIEDSFLPATQLANHCYYGMFRGCTSLVNAPELPATTLTDNCYYSMFRGCTSLNYIKMLATDISANSCLSYWVYGVSSTGTFVKSKDATWNVRGVSGIPNGWTVETE